MNNTECADARRAKAIYNLKNTEEKPCRFNAAVCNACILESNVLRFSLYDRSEIDRHFK